MSNDYTSRYDRGGVCRLSAWRRRGYGRAALTALDNELAAAGCTEVALRVAANNPHARALYESNAFHLTGYTMARQLVQQ
ncbi:GNAT family N-acetyltransferase [Sodalis endosymbiont of Spalangia cameroni]|uniref:GNAT family N-acetyltransferase n=1 Tax=Sodalis praecaptivus TaxID=1239307 RepID=UPI0031F940B4